MAIAGPFEPARLLKVRNGLSQFALRTEVFR